MLLLVVLAEASPLELGLGVRASENDAHLAGVHGSVGYRVLPTLSLDVGLFACLDPGVPSDLDQTLLDIAFQGDPNTTLQVPARYDAAAIDVLADWSVVERPPDEGLSGGIALLGGLSARLRANEVLIVSDDYKAGVEGAEPAAVGSVLDPTFAVGPAAGFALEGLYGPHLGLRWTGLARAAWEEEPDYGNIDPQTGQPEALDSELTVSLVWSLDAVVRW